MLKCILDLSKACICMGDGDAEALVAIALGGTDAVKEALAERGCPLAGEPKRKCIWDSGKECDCLIGKSTILTIDAAAMAFALGKCERLGIELAEYGCGSAKETLANWL